MAGHTPHRTSRKPIGKKRFFEDRTDLNSRKKVSGSPSEDFSSSHKKLEPARIQKFLANVGLGSRREIERWIHEGKLFVNRKPALIGMTVSAEDHFELDGKSLLIDNFQPKTKVILYHKPIKEICSRHDPEGRITVYQNLPKLRTGKWISIGRLDFMTSGLLLFTNDGQLANKMMHPRHEIEREYAVRILGEVSDEMIQCLLQGMEIDGEFLKFDTVIDAGGENANHWYHVTVKEGKYHEIRRLWESQGVTVSRLIRVRFGRIQLPRDLKMGHSRWLTDEEVQTLIQDPTGTKNEPTPLPVSIRTKRPPRSAEKTR